MANDERLETLDLNSTDSANARESVSFHRRSELAGVEIRSLKNSARAFRFYSTDFEFLAPISWHGEIWHRRRQALMDSSTVLSAHPGEVFFTRRVIRPGAANFLAIDRDVFHEYLSEHPLPANKLQLRPLTKMSDSLKDKLLEVFRVVRPGPSALEIQSAMVEFVAAMVVDLLEESSAGTANIDSDLRTAQRVHECLH
ncbi:MAG TPA: hypothetical protein VJV79_40895, partial [Polyangiaceae bacterium]|nr:hypothetical protein [Polyangiaceae bacterium]